MARLTLPLGVDIGETRIRVVEASLTADGPRITAVAVRDAPAGSCSSGIVADPEFVSALIDDAIRELGTKERRCNCAIGEPQALIRGVDFPPMSARERERSAHFEAARFIDFPPEDALVRVHGSRQTGFVLGVARRDAVHTRIRALRSAGLKPVGMDHEACAFARAFNNFDAVINMGATRTALHVFRGSVPQTLIAFCGGGDITRAIQRDLGIDEPAAEKRKRILGTAGAGERARSALITDITALIQNARAISPVNLIALTGNAARLHGLREDLALASSSAIEIAVSPVLYGEHFGADVLRSAATDWSLGAALALWNRAA